MNKDQTALKLKNGHLILDKSLAQLLFAGESYVQVIFDAKDQTLLIARDTDDVFRSFHNAKRELLKDKNRLGDKSINLRELLMDNELDDRERNLPYQAHEARRLLKVYCKN